MKEIKYEVRKIDNSEVHKNSPKYMEYYYNVYRKANENAEWKEVGSCFHKESEANETIRRYMEDDERGTRFKLSSKHQPLEDGINELKYFMKNEVLNEENEWVVESIKNF